MVFDNLAPGVKPDDVGSENEPEKCKNCGGDVYPTGADTVSLGHGVDLFCDDDCRQEYLEEVWAAAIENQERLPENVEEYIQKEMI